MNASPTCSLFATLSQKNWWKLGIEWNLDLNLMEILVHSGIMNQNITCFNEIMILGCWALCNHRNQIIFHNGNRIINSAFQVFKEYSLWLGIGPSLV